MRVRLVIYRTYCLSFICDWVYQAAYFDSSIKRSPIVINRTVSLVISHLCPFQIPLTSLLYFTPARWSHIKIFLRNEGLEWVGLGNFFSFCTKHNLDLCNMLLICGQKYKNWLLYIMAFVSLFSLIIWIFRPCKLLRPSMHRHRLSPA
jgi:hypothetical protein